MPSPELWLEVTATLCTPSNPGVAVPSNSEERRVQRQKQATRALGQDVTQLGLELGAIV